MIILFCYILPFRTVISLAADYCCKLNHRHKGNKKPVAFLNDSSNLNNKLIDNYYITKICMSVKLALIF